MNQLYRFILIFLLLLPVIFSCSKEEGCLDPNATNYDYDVKKSDGSCLYDMSFWTDDIKNLPLYIYIDNQFRDSLLCAWLSGEPKCGVDTFIYTSIGNIRCTSNIPLETGSHDVRVEGRDGTIWEKSIVLEENCVNIHIKTPD